MAAELSFASASLAESATAAPQLASPALAVKAGRQRGLTCGVVGLCEHGRQRSYCKECGGGGPVTILEATEVEESDWEEDPQEWVPIGEACLIGGPLGGKRKR